MKSEKQGRMIAGIVLLVILSVSAYQIMDRSGKAGPVMGNSKTETVISSLISSNSLDLPDYAYNSQSTQAGYIVAKEIPDVLVGVPCYCSCRAIGHKSLKDCFLEGEDGFEEHASYCDLCVSEALDVYTWEKEGLSLQEIRFRIDKRYSKYGEPTETPEI